MFERTRIGPILTGLAVAASGLLAALALVYANSAGVDKAAQDAEIQQAAESALGVSASTRFAMGQMLLFLDAGGLDPDALQILDEDARTGLDTLGDRTTLVGGLVDEADQAALTVSLTVIAEGALDFLDAVSEADLSTAARLATGSVGPALDRLDTKLVEIRDRSAESLASARAETGRLGTAARFMVALGVPAIALVFVAITARRRTRRITLQAELAKERDLNRSKDQLIANLSHELRTPLTGIYSAALAIEESGFVDHELAGELTEMIVDQSADLTRMVEDLLVSAQVDAGRLAVQLQPIDVAVEIAKVVREFRTTPSVKVRGATVIADAMRLRQIMRNLVSNAVRHGGDDVQIAGHPADGRYELAVMDDGPGVAAEIEGRLFSPFVHEGDQPLVTGSVGLGLSITRVLAREMGGDVTYSRANGHTIFTVTIPLAGAPETTALRVSEVERLPAG